MLSLERLASLVHELQTTCSASHKVRVLQAYPDLQEVLQHIYSDQPFGITSRAVSPHASGSDCPIKDVGHLMALLSTGQLRASKRAAEVLSAFVSANPGHCDLIKNIVDKNLKARIGPGLLRRAFGSDPATLPIALGVQYDSVEACQQAIRRSLASGHHWLYSRKIDGVRCLAKLDVHRQVSLLSRQCKPFRASLHSFKGHFDYLLRLPFEHNGESVFLDGELAVIDARRDDFTESFTDTIKLLSSDRDSDGGDAQSHMLFYFVFDCLTESELLGSATEKSRTAKLSDRLKRLQTLSPANSQSRVVLLPQWPVVDADHVARIITHQIEPLQWEGAILRRDCEYRGKRTADLVKLKLFKETECRVVDVQVAPMRFPDGGVDREEVVCKSLLTEHIASNGETAVVSVGSGMSVAERRLFAKHPDRVLGKLVTVKYFEETANERGQASLRFPVFKSLASPTIL